MSDIVERLHAVAVDAYLTPEQWAVVEEAKAEIERFRAIVDRLPVTADGVPITPGMTVYFCGRNYEAVKVDSVTTPGFADFYAEGHIDDASVLSMGVQYASTREAAEAAARDSA